MRNTGQRRCKASAFGPQRRREPTQRFFSPDSARACKSGRLAYNAALNQPPGVQGMPWRLMQANAVKALAFPP